MQTENIILITEAAKAHIQSFITSENQGLRIGLKKTGCSGYAYLIDVSAPRDGDITNLCRGLHLFIAPDSIDLLKGTTIDLVEQMAGQKKLVFNNPNADH